MNGISLRVSELCVALLRSGPEVDSICLVLNQAGRIDPGPHPQLSSTKAIDYT